MACSSRMACNTAEMDIVVDREVDTAVDNSKDGMVDRTICIVVDTEVDSAEVDTAVDSLEDRMEDKTVGMVVADMVDMVEDKAVDTVVDTGHSTAVTAACKDTVSPYNTAVSACSTDLACNTEAACNTAYSMADPACNTAEAACSRAVLAYRRRVPAYRASHNKGSDSTGWNSSGSYSTDLYR